MLHVCLMQIVEFMVRSGLKVYVLCDDVDHDTEDALVLLLDLSYSMKSADLPPSRTDRARQKLLDLLALPDLLALLFLLVYLPAEYLYAQKRKRAASTLPHLPEAPQDGCRLRGARLLQGADDVEGIGKSYTDQA